MPAIQGLESGEIHLWCTLIRNCGRTALLHRYRKLMTPEERRRELRFQAPDDRVRYVVARALLRTSLSRYAPVRPDEWSFIIGESGKPEISNTGPISRKLCFDLAQTDDLVTFGVAYDHPIGLGVGSRQKSDPAGLRILEAAYLKACGCAHKPESEQTGLFTSTGDRTQTGMEASRRGELDRWRFWQLTLNSAHHVSICAERVRLDPPRLQLSEVTPLVDERELETLEIRRL